MVTGASGFIGAALVRRLRLLDAQVYAISSSAQKQAKGEETWYACDLTDSVATTRLLRSLRPDLVFHLASKVTGSRDVQLVMPIMNANLGSVINLLTAAVGLPNTRLILAGSLEEPRDHEALPPSSPYAAAKWAATGYAKMFHHLWNVPSLVLRVAMVYGPGQKDTTKLLPYATLSMLRGDPPAVTSGTRLVDWIYIDDVVDAFLAAATTPIAAGAGQTFDIGTGIATSIRHTLDLLASVVGGSIRPRYGVIADRPLDRALIANISSSSNVLRWQPRICLREGLQRTVEWYRARISA